jgi:hypothetical protein
MTFFYYGRTEESTKFTRSRFIDDCILVLVIEAEEQEKAKEIRRQKVKNQLSYKQLRRSRIGLPRNGRKREEDTATFEG